MPSILDSVTSLKDSFEQQSTLSFLNRADADRAAASKIKRAFDVTFACFGLIATAPVLLVACLAIILESAGGPVFVQRRVGRNGKIFNIYKLRTMQTGAETQAFKTAKDDQRLTRIGFFLRITNIDELPQLINVLKGDMSFIGPRPLSADETGHIKNILQISPSYAGFLPHSRPGLVGLEQVNRVRELTYYERFELNHHYETNWSPTLDVQIFAKSLILCKHVSFAGGAGLLALAVTLAQMMHLFG